jgi:hypothetical protein
MGLKDGTLEDLILGGSASPVDDIARKVFHHMLQALDFVSCMVSSIAT